MSQDRLTNSTQTQRGYLPAAGKTAAEMVAKVKAKSADAEIYQPDEMEKILLAAPEFLVPFLVGAFAGLQAAELSRLDWSAVDLDRRIIQLRAGQAKTASRRIVPICAHLWKALARSSRHTSLHYPVVVRCAG